MSQNSSLAKLLVLLCLTFTPLLTAAWALKITVTSHAAGNGLFRHRFSYGDVNIEDAQVGVGRGHVYYLSTTDRYFNFSFPGPNKMRNLITYVEGEFITDSDSMEVQKIAGNLWERFIRFQVFVKGFQYLRFRLVAWAM